MIQNVESAGRLDVPPSRKAKKEVRLVIVILSPALLIIIYILSSGEISTSSGMLAINTNISSSPIPSSKKGITPET